MRTFLKRSFLLLLIIMTVGVAAAEIVDLPAFHSFVWGYIPVAHKEENASYTVYTWKVTPDIGRETILEYMDALRDQYSAQELVRVENEATGDLTVGYSLPDCSEMGFRAKIGEQTVRGCHTLLIWQTDRETSGGGTLYLYLNRGLTLNDTGIHTVLLPSPTPVPTPKPTPRRTSAPIRYTTPPYPTSNPNPNPYPTPTEKAKSKCPYCNNGYRDCMTCNGKGYIETKVVVPNYGGNNYGTTIERKSCPNINCQNGKVKCTMCQGTGYR